MMSCIGWQPARDSYLCGYCSVFGMVQVCSSKRTTHTIADFRLQKMPDNFPELVWTLLSLVRAWRGGPAVTLTAVQRSQIFTTEGIQQTIQDLKSSKSNGATSKVKVVKSMSRKPPRKTLHASSEEEKSTAQVTGSTGPITRSARSALRPA